MAKLSSYQKHDGFHLSSSSKSKSPDVYQPLRSLAEEEGPSSKFTQGGDGGFEFSRLIFPFEKESLRYLQSFNGPIIDMFAVFCAYLIWPDLLLMITFFLMLADPVNMLPFAVWWGFQELFNGLVKWAVQNPRPYCVYDNVRLLETTIDEGSSFPSSHAQCFAFAAIALPLVYGWNFWTIPMAPVCIFGGLTRVYIGVHFLHDVLVGWFFASIWAFGFYHSNSMDWWFALDDDTRVFCITIFFISVPALFYLAKVSFPSPKQNDIERMLYIAQQNHPTGKIVRYRSREFHSYLYQYAIILGVLIGFEFNIRDNNTDYYYQTFGDIMHIYPRIVIGLVIPIMLVVPFEILKSSDAIRQLGPVFRLMILSTPMMMIGLYEAYTVPAWSVHRNWLND